MSTPFFSDADLYEADRRLQMMTGVEAAWGLPPLPDDVKLDLATHPEIDATGLKGFLHGLAADVNRAVKTAGRVVEPFNPFAARPAGAAPLVVPEGIGIPTGPEQIPPQLPDLFQPLEQTRLYQDIMGTRRAERLSPDAVRKFKQVAYQRGLWEPPVGPDGQPVFDDRWSPDLNRIRSEMLQDDYAKRISGERWGAVPTDNLIKTLGDIFSPSSALSLLVQLDFIPDFRATAREFRTWGDKWRKWWKQPWNPRRFVDAVTGPIDDIAVPIINDILMLSGIGEAIGAVRVAYGGAKALEGLYAVKQGSALLRTATALREGGRLGSLAGRFLEFASPAAAMVRGGEAVSRMGEAGLFARALVGVGERIGGDTGPVETALRQGVGLLGKGMQAWRDLAATKAIKGVVRPVIRATMLPRLDMYFSPTGSILRGDVANRDAATHLWLPHTIYSSPIGTAISLFDFALMPRDVFAPGTFKRYLELVRRSREAATRVAREASATEALAEAWLATMPDAEKRSRFLEVARREGLKAAVVQELYGGDEELAGLGAMLATLSAAIDKDALAKVGQEGRFSAAFYAARNSRIAQVRYLEPDDVYGFLRTLKAGGKRTLGTNKGFNYWQKMLFHEDPLVREQARQTMNALIEHHNTWRQELINTLAASVTPVEVATWLKQFFPEGRTFVDLKQALDALDDLPPEVSKFFEREGPQRFIENFDPDDPLVKVVDEAAKMDPDVIAKGTFDVLSRPMHPWMGRLTVRAANHVGKEDALELLTAGNWLLLKRAALQELLNPTNGQALRANVTRILGDLATGELTDNLVSAAMDAALSAEFAARAAPVGVSGAGQLSGPSRLVATAQHLQQAGVDLTRTRSLQSALQEVEKQIEALTRHDVWRQWFNIPDGDQAGQLYKLEDKLRLLRNRANFMAMRVRGLPEDVEQFLAERGYVPVWGVDFLTPKDIMDQALELGEVSRAVKNKHSLGTFLTPHSNQELSQLIKFKLTREMAALLNQRFPDLQQLGYLRGASHYSVAEEVVDALSNYVLRQREHLQQLKLLGESSGRFQRFLHRLPENAFAPIWIRDLGESQIREAFEMARLNLPQNKEFLHQVRRVIQEAHDIGWKYKGLASLEDWIRKQSPGMLALNVAGRIFSLPEGHLKGTLAVGAVLSGLSAGVAEEGTPAEKVAAGLGGAVLGAGLAAGFYGAGKAFPLIERGLERLPEVARGLENVPGGRALAVAAGGLAGAGLGAATQGEEASPERRLLAAAIGGVTGAALTRQRIHTLTTNSPGWLWWANLPDDLARFRDKFRFALSPIFDAQRYLETALMGQLQVLPEGKRLPLNLSMDALYRGTYKQELRAIIGNKKASKEMLEAAKATAARRAEAVVQEAKSLWLARRGKVYEGIDELQRFLDQQGILGFSPEHTMAAAYYRLVKQLEIDPDRAEDIVHRLVGYSVKGRSPAELSVNFVFFPFSYQKKLYTELSRFMFHDLGRVVLVHDALKAYDVMNQRYDLSDWWRDHVPLLRTLQKFNPWAFGVSPGRFGGINRPFIDAFSALAQHTFLAPFVPQTLSVTSPEQAGDIIKVVRGFMPIWRDTELVLDDLAQQGHVALSRSHLTPDAEARLAANLYQKKKEEIDAVAKAYGFDGWLSVFASDTLAPLRQALQSYKQELLNKYPSWREFQTRLAAESIKDANERLALLGRKGPVYDAFRLFDSRYQQVKEMLSQYGISLEREPEDVPEDVFDELRSLAIELAARQPGFWAIYRRLYQRVLGPIGTEY